MRTIVLWTVALAALPLSRRFTGDYFSPAALITAVWFGSFGLYALHLPPYPEMRATTTYFILGAVALMVAGATVGQRLLSSRAPAPDTVRLPRHPNVWVSGLALLGIAGTVWFVVLVTNALGPDAFSAPHVVRRALNTFVLSSQYLVLQYFCLGAALLAFGL